MVAACGRLGVRGARTTVDPGVWVVDGRGERKVCAVGVQVRRGVTRHGVGLNVRDEGTEMWGARYLNDGAGGSLEESQAEQSKGMLSWGFGRIVACGLEGKSVTWLEAEQEEGQKKQLTTWEAAKAFAEEFGRGLQGVDGVVESVTYDGIGKNIPEELVPAFKEAEYVRGFGD